MEDRRPSPEEMLSRAAAEAARTDRGQLKIFFGAAPGVGKTYAMLEVARARKRQGSDVVIGLVETHGRKETAVLTEGLEVLPPRRVEHRGVALNEFDLDGALARRPGLLLVDELAHTNAPGSRHARRWQDVQELLEEGIDVWTTLNVQHVESLKDLVAQVTSVQVQETVPDSVLDMASEIELVDLPPDDLLQRMRDGKVYIPAQAERAMRNFFRKGNLIALRELALRRTAERVDAQALEWRREQGIERSWRTRERILVGINHRARSAGVVRAARRAADRLHAPWIVMTVETPGFRRLAPADRERLAEHLALAERLGAETLVLRGERTAEEILNVAREREVTRILIGRPTHPAWRDWVGRSLLDEIVRGAEGIEVLVTSGEQEDGARSRPARRHEPAPFVEYAWALVPVLVTTVICLLSRPYLSLADQAMVYLLGVLIAASKAALAPALVATFASVAALDFFFVPPFFTFAVGDLRYFLTFTVMLIVGVSVSRRTVLIREQADSARERERRTAALYAMSREFAVEDEPLAIARSAVHHVRELLGVEAIVLAAQKDGNLATIAGGGSGSLDGERERAVARWVYDHGRPAGHGTDTLPASEAVFLPLNGMQGVLGAFGVALGTRGEPPTPAQWQLLETFVAQASLAYERALLREQAARTELAVEREQTRNALLSTVSHDLRTPLASITGAASALLDEAARLGPQASREMVETIKEESERLGRLVGNLLDLTRLESGALVVAKEWCPVEELVDSAITRLRDRTRGREIVRDLPAELELAWVDPVLFEQVLLNLFENALKYSPPESKLEIRAWSERDRIVFEVADHGPGIPPGEEERIFEKFYRIPDGGRAEGTGLGLTVCQAIVKAHGGSIRAENRPGGGTVVHFEIPTGPNRPTIPVEPRERTKA